MFSIQSDAALYATRHECFWLGGSTPPGELWLQEIAQLQPLNYRHCTVCVHCGWEGRKDRVRREGESEEGGREGVGSSYHNNYVKQSQHARHPKWDMKAFYMSLYTNILLLNGETFKKLLCYYGIYGAYKKIIKLGEVGSRLDKFASLLWTLRYSKEDVLCEGNDDVAAQTPCSVVGTVVVCQQGGYYLLI